jgi:hypothetical protein
MARYVDDFTVEEVADAIRKAGLSDRALTMLAGHATAPNRALSRLELARTVGGSTVNVTNSVLGAAIGKIAVQIDPTLLGEWRPDDGTRRDWVMFANFGPARWTPLPDDEPDGWVFVMRPTLAHALVAAGRVTAAAELDEDAVAVLEGMYGEEDGELWAPVDMISEIASAEAELDGLSETERISIVAARLGQGVFLDRLIDAWDGACAVTGVTFLPVLIASHIVPWVDATNEERLDPDNGLLLAATLDRLFDAGFITFDDDGAIRISPVVPEDEYAAMGVSKELRLARVPEGSRQYLARHREEYFVAEPDTDEKPTPQ